MAKVKVRIAVAVDHAGDWNACGGNGFKGDKAMEYAVEVIGSGERRYWVEAELEVPEDVTVQGSPFPSES